MSEQDSLKKNENTLIDMLAIILKRRWLIILGTGTITLITVVIMVLSLLLPPDISFLPNEYTSKALMLINDFSNTNKKAMELLRSKNLEGIADLTGIKAAEFNYSDLLEYLTETNSFLDEVIKEFDLVTRYKITKYIRTESREALKEKLKSEYNRKNGVYSISFSDWDPVFAKHVVDFCVDLISKRFDVLQLDKNKLEKKNLEENISNIYNEIMKLEEQSRQLEYYISNISNNRNAVNIPSIVFEANKIKREIGVKEELYKQLKIRYEMVRIDIASETPIFQVLEKGEIPDKKSGPKRLVITIVISYSALFFFIFLSFILEIINNIKRNPEAVEKLKGIKR